MEGVDPVQEMLLRFTFPGKDWELVDGGKDIDVTLENVDQFVEAVLNHFFNVGVRKQVVAFIFGFNRVFPIESLRMFSISETESLICGALPSQSDEFWTIPVLEESIKCDRGYSTSSRVIKDLFEVLSSFDDKERTTFLTYVTGSSRLPIQGWKGLDPPLTVVRANPVEKYWDPSEFLPTVSTCFHYLKLPEYCDCEILKKKLVMAMESKSRFHLS
mmetsp:Transcript_42589/g.59679  ORF Transcript_42589/g.59679 Transcript_42589/m.59679 type:complete len:216 (+) Transcript_42589:169-816(+)